MNGATTRDVQRALFSFWNCFGVPAYLEDLVIQTLPSGQTTTPEFPYITFNFARDTMFMNTVHNVKIWTRSMSFVQLWEIAERIEKVISERGHVLHLENGALWLNRGTPFMQPLPQDDNTLRCYYINYYIRHFTK